MRTDTATNATVFRYPDAFGFVFNPCIITISNANLQSVSIDIEDEENNSFTGITASAYDGKCVIDLSQYIQSLFDKMGISLPATYASTLTDLGIVRDISVDVTATLSNSTTDTLTFNTAYIWGAQKNGEIFNQERKVTWWTNFPFALCVFYITGKTSYLNVDTVDMATPLDTTGMWMYNISQYGSATTLYFQDNCGTFKTTIKEDEVNLTQTIAYDTRVTVQMKTAVPTNEKGVYLRWIDRRGFLCHYLFDPNTETLTAADKSNIQRDYLGVMINKARSESILLGAINLDKDEWWWIADIVTSPIVQWYIEDGVWQNVRIVSGSFQRKEDTLQDFACTMQIDEVKTQQL